MRWIILIGAAAAYFAVGSFLHGMLREDYSHYYGETFQLIVPFWPVFCAWQIVKMPFIWFSGAGSKLYWAIRKKNKRG